jgi:hypothetical protein
MKLDWLAKKSALEEESVAELGTPPLKLMMLALPADRAAKACGNELHVLRAELQAFAAVVLLEVIFNCLDLAQPILRPVNKRVWAAAVMRGVVRM